MKLSQAFHTIEEFYGDQKAERSGVPLINHIREGLTILEYIGADIPTKCAWCLHPIFQADDDLYDIGQYQSQMIDGQVVMLVMEYRNQANAWLSDKVYFNTHYIVRGFGEPTSGPLVGVRHMLIADKVQNYKDFEVFHKGTHERSDELEYYFRQWFRVLGIDDIGYTVMCEAIDKHKERYEHKTD